MQQDFMYTNRSYKMSMWILSLLGLAVVVISLNIQPVITKVLFGLPIIGSGILGLAGTYFILKGIHEPLTEKKVIALTVNLTMVVLILAILLSNTFYS
ncbi:hypothetical protein [Robiginitalea aurantiaca]|uniref:Uncharacterized protein n=1 Tax=Robiginitalea aurantiaca TaxID=3056915 RepID=A0ABT7WFC2_9FLAO|nr:hypothetical protein [Robiginitalea aurantiaca]MDM9631623.1 hypothetical protein [Robiginitalea aurantiaca]